MCGGCAVVLCGIISAVLGNVMVKSFFNGEMVTPQNSEANVEYHCFELDPKGRPKYVRGSYGNRGYFEGAVNRGIATVNFYEITLDGDRLIPSTGAGYLSYTDNWSVVKGPFWNGGGGNITKPEDWGITRERKLPHDMTQAAIIENKCLWARSGDMQPNVPVNVNGALFGTPPDSLNTFRNTVVGAMDTNGGATGGYVYRYSDQDCMDLQLNCGMYGNTEYGNYGLHAVSATLRTTKIFVSTWNAVTGPAAGQMGSSIYALSQNNGKMQSKGIFCYQYQQSSPSSNPDRPPKTWSSLGSCSQDNGPAIMNGMGVTPGQILQQFGDWQEVMELDMFTMSISNTP